MIPFVPGCIKPKNVARGTGTRPIDFVLAARVIQTATKDHFRSVYHVSPAPRFPDGQWVYYCSKDKVVLVEQSYDDLFRRISRYPFTEEMGLHDRFDLTLTLEAYRNLDLRYDPLRIHRYGHNQALVTRRDYSSVCFIDDVAEYAQAMMLEHGRDVAKKEAKGLVLSPKDVLSFEVEVNEPYSPDTTIVCSATGPYTLSATRPLP